MNVHHLTLDHVSDDAETPRLWASQATAPWATRWVPADESGITAK